jgi:hypothetical protein
MIHDVEMPNAASEPANTTNVESTGALTIVDVAVRSSNRGTEYVTKREERKMYLKWLPGRHVLIRACPTLIFAN